MECKPSRHPCYDRISAFEVLWSSHPPIIGFILPQKTRSFLCRIIHGSTPTRSASEGGRTSCPRLRFGLVWRTVRKLTRPINKPGYARASATSHNVAVKAGNCRAGPTTAKPPRQSGSITRIRAAPSHYSHAVVGIAILKCGYVSISSAFICKRRGDRADGSCGRIRALRLSPPF